MSVAAIDPVPERVQEPTTIRELYARALVDTREPGPLAHMRWVFWHARAVGRLETARASLKRLYDQEAMLLAQNLSTLNPTLKAAFAAEMPNGPLRQSTEDSVEVAATFVEATARVVDMLEVATRAPVRAVR